MKTFVVLCALACSTLAAPTQSSQSQQNWQNREKKSPTFGSLSSPGHESLGHGGSYHHGIHQPHLVHQEHLGLKKPLFYDGHHDIHHGHGYGHHGHGFRSEGEEEEKDAHSVTEVTELKNAEDANGENMEVALESNIKMARVAVENMQHDLDEMEKTANARKQWKHSDSKSDTILHQNIATAKEALENVQNSFNNLQAINEKNLSGKAAEAIQDAELEKMTEEERMSKWKSAIETIQKNVEIANNIKESFTSGKNDEQEKLLPNHEGRSTMAKPVAVEAHKKPNLDKNSNTEMEMSASTKVQMRDDDGGVLKEKSASNPKTEIKAIADVDPASEKHAESAMMTSEDKHDHLETETPKSTMKASASDVDAVQANKKPSPAETQKSADPKAMKANKEQMPIHQESQKEHSMKMQHQHHNTNKAREEILPNEENEKSASHIAQLHPAPHPMRASESTIINTKATQQFGNGEVPHHTMHKQPSHHSNGKNAAIDITTLMKERDFDAKETEMDHSASEMKSAHIQFESENKDDSKSKLMTHDDMKSLKSAESLDTASHPNMKAAMRDAENAQMEKSPKHHESARTFGSPSYGPSVAVNLPSYGPSVGVSAGYGAAANSYGAPAGSSYGPSAPVSVSYGSSAPAGHSYGPSVAASVPSVSYAPSHSYGSSASSYGSGVGSGSSVSINLAGSGGQSGAVGVFPNARIGGCAVPLLLSCSPSVVSGSLAKVHPSYSSPAQSYGATSGSYKANEQPSSHTKRDVKVNKVLAKKARRSYSPILDKKF